MRSPLIHDEVTNLADATADLSAAAGDDDDDDEVARLRQKRKGG